MDLSLSALILVGKVGENMTKSELNFKDSEFVKSSYKDHNIKIKHIKAKQEMKIVVPLNDINKEKLQLSDDKNYYLLYISPTVKHPDYIDIKLKLKIAIKRETIDIEKLPLDEIVKRAFIEGDMFRSHYNPNTDGRIWNTYYGGSF